MKRALFGLALGAAMAISMLAASAASAQVRCQFGVERASLPTAGLAIADWEAGKSLSLSPQVRSTLEADLCRAVRYIAIQSGASAQDIDAASRKPIRAYLDDVLSGGAQFPSLAARLEAVFLLGASGQLPEQRRMAVLTFHFTRADRIRVGNGQWGPSVPRLVSEYGTFSYQGFRAERRVCEGSFVIDSSAGAVVRC